MFLAEEGCGLLESEGYRLNGVVRCMDAAARRRAHLSRQRGLAWVDTFMLQVSYLLVLSLPSNRFLVPTVACSLPGVQLQRISVVVKNSRQRYLPCA